MISALKFFQASSIKCWSDISYFRIVFVEPLSPFLFFAFSVHFSDSVIIFEKENVRTIKGPEKYWNARIFKLLESVVYANMLFRSFSFVLKSFWVPAFLEKNSIKLSVLWFKNQEKIWKFTYHTCFHLNMRKMFINHLSKHCQNEFW